MKCPRCHQETKDGTLFCPSCGAPLALGAEPAPRPLDASVSLDRRAAARPQTDAAPLALDESLDLARTQVGPAGDLPDAPALPPPFVSVPAPGRPAPAPRPAPRKIAAPVAPPPAAAVARSHWDLGSGLGGAADRTFAPPPVPISAAADRTFGPGAPLAAADRTFGPGAPLAAADRTFGPGEPLSLDAAPTGPLAAPAAPRRAPPLAPPAPLASAPEPSGFPIAPLVDGPEPGGPAPRSLAADLAAMVDPALPDAEVDAVEVHLRRAPSSRRTIAWAIDCMPFGALLGWALSAVHAGEDVASPWGVAGRLAADTGVVLPLVAGVGILFVVYQTLCHALAGATLGKWLAGVRVAGPDGRRPTFGRSAVRSALSVVSAALLGLGLLLAFFTLSGRALHDLLAGTWVVEAP